MERLRFVNEGSAACGWHRATDQPRLTKQPLSFRRHRASHMSFLRSLPPLLLAAISVVAASQTAAVPAPPTGAGSTVSRIIGPSLSQVAQALNGINVRRWKAPNSVRDAADGNVASIQRDLSGTLAGLLQQADASPTSVPAAFSVYRNLDALYDTLLRVVETAELAAPDNEEAALESALKSLENARSSLGDAILNGSQTQQIELVRLRAAITAAAGTQRTPVKTTVIDDGPAAAHTTTHRRHTTTTKKPSSNSPPAAKPSPNSSNPQ